MLRQEQSPLKLSPIEAAAIRQSVWAKCRQDLDLLIWIAVTSVEDWRGKQYCRSTFNDNARTFTPILLR
jgi:hypothetical protein